MLRKIRFAVVCIGLGLLAGFGARHLMKESGELLRRPELTITVPEGGVKSDAFSLRLFREQVHPYAGFAIAPATLSEAFIVLTNLAEGKVKKEIEQLQLCTAHEPHNAAPDISILAAAEESLSYSPKSAQCPIFRLPFRDNLPSALSSFNTMLGCQAASSRDITPNTRLALAMSTTFTMNLQSPFCRKNNKTTTFYTAEGGTSNVTMMRQRAMLRYASDTQGSWEAVAFMLKSNQPGGTEPVALIAIRPHGTAAKFAETLTPELFSTIRTALATAEPRDCCVELPLLNGACSGNILQPLEKQLGLHHLTDITSRDWMFTTERVGLNSMVEHLSFRIEQPEGTENAAEIDRAEHSISFDNPFIWAVTDLTTPAPPYLMGMYQ